MNDANKTSRNDDGATAMTSHHDVAGVVAELQSPLAMSMFLSKDHMISHLIDQREAAVKALESQAKALSEAEAERDAARDSAADFGMLSFKWMERHDRIAAGKDGGEYPTPADVPNVLARALAAEARLADVKRELTPSGETKSAHIGEYHFEIEMLDEDGETILRRIAVPWTTIKEIMAAIAARAFTNAAKTQESKDAVG